MVLNGNYHHVLSVDRDIFLCPAMGVLLAATLVYNLPSIGILEDELDDTSEPWSCQINIEDPYIPKYNYLYCL